MKILEQRSNLIDTYTHGYFSAKKYFKGEFLREIVVTVYDIVERTSDFGYLYLCEGNVLLYLQGATKGREHAVNELEQSDTLREVTTTDETLKTILNQTTGAETSLKVKTTSEISYMFLNERYIILAEIQADLTFGSKTANLLTIYLTGEDFREKVRHTIGAINLILVGEKFDRESKLFGIPGEFARLNIIAVICGIVFVVLFIFLAPFIGGWTFGLLVWVLSAVVIFALIKMKQKKT